MTTEPRSEIVELHEFLEGWFSGTTEASDASFAHLENALADDFVIVFPSANRADRATILREIRAAHGSWRRYPGGRIEIRDVELRFESGSVVVATYEEWQHGIRGETKGRISTVVFQREPTAPHGLLWRHLHETWLPSK